MKENNTLTTQWYQHRQIIRCLSLLPDEGMDKELFVLSLDPDLQAEARACIQKRKYVVQEEGRIRPLSPLLFYGVHPTQDQILSWLTGLYMELEDAIKRYTKPAMNSVEEEAAELCEQFSQLQSVENLTDLEVKLLDLFAPLINQLKMTRIGGLNHLKDEIRQAHNAVGMGFFKRYGDKRMDDLCTFHDQKGKDICAVFNNSMERIPLGETLQENLLDLIVQYYELSESHFEEMAATAEKLLVLQLKREAPAWILSETHMKLSDGYMGSFKTNPKWLELSDYHLEKSCEYARIACEEEEKKALSAQEVLNE